MSVEYERSGNETIIRITETGVGVADEFGPFTVPQIGVITAFKQELISGTATGTSPALGRRAGFGLNSLDDIASGLNTAGNPSHNGQSPVRYFSPGGEMWLRSTPDAGSDNIIETEIYITGGL